MNEKAYGCSKWKDGCKFTIWKNTLIRAGGPEISPDMVMQLIQSGRVDTPEGVITYAPSSAEARPLWQKKQ